MAWKITGRDADAFLQACMMIQWRTKLIQFEYDDRDGEIRPMIEWPIEDGTVTTKQLSRALMGAVQMVDRYGPVLDVAKATGKIDVEAVV